MNQLSSIFSFLGFLLRAVGFAVLGYGLGTFTMDAYKKAVWQVQAALALGFFGLLVGLTNYASAGSMGTFALGAGAAIILANMPKKDEESKKE